MLLTLVLASGCAGSKSRLKLGQTAEGEVVEAEGYAPNESDVIKTKRASLVDAQRNAVEKAVGVFVSARTLVEKAVAIENNILARTEGYVKKYEVLAEGPEGDLYKTKIRALVALKELEADLKQLSLLKAPELHRPRMTIKLNEEIDKEPSDEHVAATALAKTLADQGFVIVSDERAKEAELALTGKAAAYPFQQNGLGGFVSYRARLSAQAMKPGTKDVVVSVTKEASGLGGTAELAGFKAMEQVAQVAGQELATLLSEKWSGKQNLLVFVEGVQTFSDVERLRKHFAAQPSVSDLSLRSYEEQMAQFEIQLGNGSATDLASSLASSRSVLLSVLEANSQTLRLKLN